MDPILGATLAGIVAAATIIAAAMLPMGRLDRRILRTSGALSIGLVGLAVLGIPLPSLAPLTAMAAGVAMAALVPAWKSRQIRGLACTP